MSTIRINLWSGPRNVSTALMYAFAQRRDTQVVDEPLYAHYLTVSDADEYHPGAADVLATQDNDGARVVRELILGPCAKPVLFCKQMTHHLVQIDRSFMQQTVNVLLTRTPAPMILSFSKNIETPTMRDIGYAMQAELYQQLCDMGQEPPVLDSKQILLNPRGVLRELCVRIGIPFEEAMLHWTPGARPEDGSWAKYWYANVHKSSGFAPYVEKDEPFPDRLRPLLEESLPYYEMLEKVAIKV